MKEPAWIDEQDALTIHDRLLALHGGPSGVRDKTLLSSALARPRQHLAYSMQMDIIRMVPPIPLGSWVIIPSWTATSARDL